LRSWFKDKDAVEECNKCPLFRGSGIEGRIYYVECDAADRFDCLQILKVFYPEIYRLPEGRRRELVEKIRSGNITPEEAAKYL
jgi:hypothetical protein